jgi:hypothetical protein
MKKIIAFIMLMFLFQIALFSQNKEIDLIITVDKEIVKNIEGAQFVVIDTINNINDTLRVYYYHGHLSIKEIDFNKISKSDNVLFCFSIKKSIDNQIVSEYYYIDYKREWLFTTYSLLHIYSFKTKEYKKKTRDKMLDKYTYEFYSPNGFVLIRAKKL